VHLPLDERQVATVIVNDGEVDELAFFKRNGTILSIGSDRVASRRTLLAPPKPG
jgi:soluble P-type ATPase